MVVCFAQAKSGFSLYFLDATKCVWVKLIQCLDLDSSLLPSAQLVCEGAKLMVLLTSVSNRLLKPFVIFFDNTNMSGNLHFMEIDCNKWEMQLVPVVGIPPFENPRELVSLVRYLSVQFLYFYFIFFFF